MTRSPFFCGLLFLLLTVACQHHDAPLRNNSPLKAARTKKAAAFQDQADVFYKQAQYDSAFYYYTQAKSYFDATTQKDHLAYCLLQMARAQQTMGDYFGSETHLIEALPYLKEDSSYFPAASILLGIAAKELKNYDDALAYYDKAYTISKDSLTKAVALNNMANVYTEQGQYTKSVALLEQVLRWSFLDTLPKRKALYQNNLGYAYTHTQAVSKGVQLMQQALATRLQEDDSYGKMDSYLCLAKYYLPHQVKTSQKLAKQAYVTATQHHSIDERLEALLLLIKTAQNNTPYALQYAVLNDSITQVRNAAKNQFAKIRYDARRVNEENLKLKNKNITMDLALQKSQNETNTWIGLAALLLLSLLMVYTHLKNKGRLEKQKASYLTETKIAKKIHDEIANDVFQTMSYVETQRIEEPAHKETLINLLDNLYQRSRNISKENESIETGESFIDNLIAMLNGYKSASQNIIIKKDETIAWHSLAAIKKITLFRVLQELLVNMKKHSEASIVIVSFGQHKQSITIDYSDNGKGFASSQIKKSGMANVENRIRNLNGSVTFDTKGLGLKVKISIPK